MKVFTKRTLNMTTRSNFWYLMTKIGQRHDQFFDRENFDCELSAAADLEDYLTVRFV